MNDGLFDRGHDAFQGGLRRPRVDAEPSRDQPAAKPEDADDHPGRDYGAGDHQRPEFDHRLYQHAPLCHVFTP
jgi:hypothetical protein